MPGLVGVGKTWFSKRAVAYRRTYSLPTLAFKKMSRACAHCGEPGAAFACGACGSAVYCSKACQISHWASHRRLCGLLRSCAIAVASGQVGGLRKAAEHQHRRVARGPAAPDTTKGPSGIDMCGIEVLPLEELLPASYLEAMMQMDRTDPSGPHG